MTQGSICPRPEHLRAFVGGQLAPLEAQAVEFHLGTCAECAAAVLRPTRDNGPTVSLRPGGGRPEPVVKRFVPFDVAPTPAAADSEPSISFLNPAAGPDELGRLANYRVLRLLGHGGMGMVFQAEDLHLGRQVALKVMKPGLDATIEPSQRFLREARTVASIKHPHVVTVFQVGQEGNVVFMAMEYLEGRSLDAALRSGQWPTTTEMVRIGREIADGLAAIHRHGLIHRDIKPANLWLEEPHGHVKILDFGLARPMQGDSRLTGAGVVVGTPAYMAPEQARGGEVDARSDLFALGCVLYTLCTGAEPFKGPTPLALLISQAEADPPPVRERNPAIPTELAELVMRLLAKRPEHRPACAEEVVAALDRIRRIMAGTPVEDDVVSATPAWTRLPPSSASTIFARRRIRVGVLLLLVGWAGAAGIAAYHFLFRSTAAPAAAYLADLRVVDSVDWMRRPPGPPPGRFGGPPDDVPPDAPPWPPPARTSDELSLRGQALAHSIFMHGSPQGTASVSFALDARYTTFTTAVSLNDSAPISRSPLTFAVYGDDRLLWESQPVQSQTEELQKCTAEVRGVKVLKLVVRTRGDERGTHGLWIEPQIHR